MIIYFLAVKSTSWIRWLSGILELQPNRACCWRAERWLVGYKKNMPNLTAFKIIRVISWGYPITIFGYTKGKQLLWWRIAGSRTKRIHFWSLYKMDPESWWPGLRSLSFHLLGRLPGDLAQSRSSIIDESESISQLLICFCYTWHQKNSRLWKDM